MGTALIIIGLWAVVCVLTILVFCAVCNVSQRQQYSPPVPPTVVGEKQGSADADLRSPAHSPVLGGQGAGE